METLEEIVGMYLDWFHEIGIRIHDSDCSQREEIQDLYTEAAHDLVEFIKYVKKTFPDFDESMIYED